MRKLEKQHALIWAVGLALAVVIIGVVFVQSQTQADINIWPSPTAKSAKTAHTETVSESAEYLVAAAFMRGSHNDPSVVGDVQEVATTIREDVNSGAIASDKYGLIKQSLYEAVEIVAHDANANMAKPSTVRKGRNEYAYAANLYQFASQTEAKLAMVRESQPASVLSALIPNALAAKAPVQKPNTAKKKIPAKTPAEIELEKAKKLNADLQKQLNDLTAKVNALGSAPANPPPSAPAFAAKGYFRFKPVEVDPQGKEVASLSSPIMVDIAPYAGGASIFQKVTSKTETIDMSENVQYKIDAYRYSPFAVPYMQPPYTVMPNTPDSKTGTVIGSQQALDALSAHPAAVQTIAFWQGDTVAATVPILDRRLDKKITAGRVARAVIKTRARKTGEKITKEAGDLDGAAKANGVEDTQIKSEAENLISQGADAAADALGGEQDTAVDGSLADGAGNPFSSKHDFVLAFNAQPVIRDGKVYAVLSEYGKKLVDPTTYMGYNIGSVSSIPGEIELKPPVSQIVAVENNRSEFVFAPDQPLILTVNTNKHDKDDPKLVEKEAAARKKFADDGAKLKAQSEALDKQYIQKPTDADYLKKKADINQNQTKLTKWLADELAKIEAEKAKDETSKVAFIDPKTGKSTKTVQVAIMPRLRVNKATAGKQFLEATLEIDAQLVIFALNKTNGYNTKDYPLDANTWFKSRSVVETVVGTVHNMDKADQPQDLIKQ